MIKKRMRNGLDRSSILHLIGAVALILQLIACGGGGVSGGSTTGAGSASSLGNGPGTATVTWDANPEPDVIGYRVYVGTSSGQYIEPRGAGIDVTGASRFTVTGLTKGIRYFFAVTALDASGNESPYSREVFKDIP